MDLTYLVVAVFGVCAAPCRSLPTAATAPAAAATAPAPTQPSSLSLQAAAAATEPADNRNGGKRSRSLQFMQPAQQYHHDLYDDDDLYNGMLQQQQQQQQQQDQDQDGQLQRTDDDDEYGANDVVEQDPRLSGRARPHKPDSPVYFIRLPPQPYMYVPGYGYVSQPTRLEPPPFTQRPHSPFLNLPLGYVSNGKPVGVYTLPQQPNYPNQYQGQYQQQARPKPNRRPQPPPATFAPPPPPPPQQPDSPIYNLDKGPYVFNGRPSDVYLLQSAYDNLYSEVLQNIYP